MKILRVLLALLLATPVHAQGVGQLGSGQLWGNSTASRAPAAPTTVTGIVDRAISSTQGAVLTRQGSAWVGLAPGTVGLPLVSGGAAANLGYSVLGIAGGGTAGVTAAAARTNLGLGTIATQNAGAVAITGGTITGMANPAISSDVANKSYVDSLATVLKVLAASVYATAAVLPNTPTYSNGASGVGATLTAGANAAIAVDGASPTLGQRILVKNQASAFQNGIYTVTTVGSGAAAWVLTRATDFDTAAEMLAGSYTFVSSGATNVGSSFTLTGAVTTVGTTDANFTLFLTIGTGVSSLGGSTGAITVGAGLSIGSNILTNSGVAALNALTGGITLAGSNGISVSPAGSTITLSPDSGFKAVVNPSSGNLQCQQHHQILWADANICLTADTLVMTSADPSGLVVVQFTGTPVAGDIVDVLVTADGGTEYAAVYTVQGGDTLAKIGTCIVNANYAGCAGVGNVGIQNLANVYNCSPSGASCPSAPVAGQGGYAGGRYVGYTVPYLNGLAMDVDGSRAFKLRFSIVTAGSLGGTQSPSCVATCAAGSIPLDNNPNFQFSRAVSFAPAAGSAIYAAYYVSSQSVAPTEPQTVYAQDAVFVYNSTSGAQVSCKTTAVYDGTLASCTGPHMVSVGTAPSTASCTGASSITGTDHAGKVVIGGGGTTGCNIAFHRLYPDAPSCIVTERSGVSFTYSTTTAAINLFRAGGLASLTFDWHCTGNNFG